MTRCTSAAASSSGGVRGGGGSAGSSGAAAGVQARPAAQRQAADYRLSTLQHAAVLAPPAGSGLLRLRPETSLAESITLRGARLPQGGPCTAQAAAAALDVVLRSEPQRYCVVHRCTAAAPLHVPLPFPGVFGVEVGAEGDIVAGWTPERAADASAAASAAAAAQGGRSSGSRDGRHVSSCPVLTRVVATSEFEGWISERAAGMRRAEGSAMGRSMAEGWGYGRGELDEVGERLQKLAGSYAEAVSDDGLDD